MRKISDRATVAAFEAYPDAVRLKLIDIRKLIFDVARETNGVGKLAEALRWGQPSYLTPETGSGSTVRLGMVPGLPAHCAVFFHCQSGLVEQFRTLYRGELTFFGNRAIVLAACDPIPTVALRHCLGLALTHHLRKRAMTKLQK